MTEHQQAVRVDDAPRLRGNLGVPAITLMVVAAAAPLGVMAGGAPLAIGLGNGTGAAGTFALVAIAMLLFAVALAAMSRKITNSGAFYAYVGHGLGPATGMAAAAISWLTYTSIQFGICAFMGVNTSAVVTVFGGPDIPWWVFTLIGVAVIAVLGYNKIDLTAKVLGIALALEVLVVIIVDIVVLAHGGDHGISATGLTPSTIFPSASSFAISAMLCGTAFIGFEATAVYRDEATDPDRTVPRATYLAIVFIGLFYCLSTWIISQGWPAAELQDASLQGAPYLLGPAERWVGTLLSDGIQILVATSLFACALSLHNILARYNHVLGRSGVLHSSLGSVHPRHGSPHTASALTTVVTLVLFVVAFGFGLDPVTEIFGWFAGLAALGFFTLLGLTCLSTVVFFARTATTEKPWQTRILPSVGFVALLGLVLVTFWYFPDLVGKEPGFAYSMALAVPVFAAVGAGAAVWLRRNRPERYANVVALTQN
ncbi:APC family permease [soil metagenome]